MLAAPTPADDEQRLEALRALALLDSPPEQRFERLTGLACRLFQVPIALVSLVDRDRQWFKSAQGLAAAQTPRDVSFCGHAILQPDLFIVEDARSDPRFADNPLVTGPPHVQFYAGAPLSSSDGYRVGTLCLIDHQPRQLDLAAQRALRDLADIVEQEINRSDRQRQRQAVLTLARITSLASSAPRERLRHGLAVASAYLQLPIAIISEVHADDYRILVQHAPDTELQDGQRFALADTYCRETLRSETVHSIAHAAHSHGGHPCYQAMRLESYVGVALDVGGRRFGTLNFSSPWPRRGDRFDEIELEFVDLLGDWVAAQLQQWQTDQALQSAYALLERSNEAARIGTWEIDLRNGHAHWSRVTREIHQVDADYQPQAQPDLSFYPDLAVRERARLAYAAAIEQGERFDVELPILTAQGQPRWIRLIGLPILEQGHCQRLHGLFQDISERKRLEQMKAEFVSTVSHELRTPLTSISGSLQLLCSGAIPADSAPARDLLRVANENAQRLGRLINDLLDMDKLQAGKLAMQIEPLQLSVQIEQAIETNRPFADRLQVELRWHAPATPLWLLADALRLQQILSNLLSNAAKFSPPGATIEIHCHADAMRVWIAVEDHGAGVPPAFQAQLFDKFSQADGSDQRHLSGTGLGLAITRGLVEWMGGEIHFRPSDGGGATFEFCLPRGPAAH